MPAAVPEPVGGPSSLPSYAHPGGGQPRLQNEPSPGHALALFEPFRGDANAGLKLMNADADSLPRRSRGGKLSRPARRLMGDGTDHLPCRGRNAPETKQKGPLKPQMDADERRSDSHGQPQVRIRLVHPLGAVSLASNFLCICVGLRLCAVQLPFLGWQARTKPRVPTDSDQDQDSFLEEGAGCRSLSLLTAHANG